MSVSLQTAYSFHGKLSSHHLWGHFLPRRKRDCPAGLPVHIVQRGNNRQVCFADDSDFKAFANWLLEGAIRYEIAIHAWVFMTNHVHLLVTPSYSDSVSRHMQFLGRYYVRYFNFQYKRTGTLFEGRFKSSVVQNRTYFLACQRYIELNPVRAGLVDDPANYNWSSYRSHAFGIAAKMWSPHSEYTALGNSNKTRKAAYRNLFKQEIDGKLIADIRHALNTGLVLGNDKFRNEVEVLTGQRQHHLKRGPKPKQPAQPRQFLL